MEQPEELPPLEVEITIDCGPFTEQLRRVQAAMVFGYHPDLADLDDELDILYRGQL